MGDQIRVLIADDHRLFHEMLHLTLRQEEGIEIVGEAPNGSTTIDAICDLKPDVIIIDIAMPDKDSIEILPALREKSPKTKALMLTAGKDEAMIFKVLKAGAKGCLSKDASISALIRAVQALHQGELWVERKLIARFFDKNAKANPKVEAKARRPKEVLTPREKEVLSLLTTGRTNKEIAKTLFISEKTVKSHLNNIFRKLNVSGRLQAILSAIDRG